jgi:hypothetical protein
VKSKALVLSGVTRYVSTTGSDANPCSLASPCKTVQHTINIAGSGDTISIAAGTYTEDISLTTNLALVGAAPASPVVGPPSPTTTISGAGLAGSVVTVPVTVTATLTGLTITGGSGTPDIVRTGATGNVAGGGIFNLGNLMVINSVVSSNVVTSTTTLAPGIGGGIFNTGALTVTSSMVMTNTVAGPAGTATFFNDGGGIFNSFTGTLLVDESTVAGNTATGAADQNGFGGGIANESIVTNTTTAAVVPILVTGSTINGNTVTATTVVTASTALGGGVATDTGTAATLANSTVTGNTANGTGGSGASGGGIDDFGGLALLTLTNDTITSNKAVTTGGGLAVGGGVDLPGAGTVGNTILASNTANGAPADCGKPVAPASDLGGNLADDATCAFTAGTSVNSSATLAASIAPLANNGGETMTQALMAGSPAINAGVVATCTAAPINDLDQRGLPRYAVLRGACDSGAFDTGGGTVPPLTVTGAIPLTTGVPARLGFAASNHNTTFSGVGGLQSFNIAYITFQRGANTFTVREPVTITCTSAALAPNHCVGTTGVIQGVQQFVLVPGTKTLTLSGPISSARGAYLQGQTATAALTISASATGKITVTGVTVTVNGVTVATWTAPLPAGTSIQFDLSAPLIL